MSGPLEGVRVLDLSAVVAGPLTAALLSDQGADVIKVERIGTGDIQRNVGSKRNGFSGSFHMLNRGKRSISLDLTHPDGVRVVKKLAETVDVVLQNFRPGVVDRLGVGFGELSEINPRIVYLSISGFGQRGPNAGKRAYDPIIQTYSGIADVQGSRRGEGPEQVNQLIMDKLTAYTGFQAITAALYSREKTGKGQHIELSMLDTAIAFMWPDSGADSILQGDDIEHSPPISAAGLLFEMDDGWGAMMTLSDHEFLGMCKALGLDDVAADDRFNTLASRMKNRKAYREEVPQKIHTAVEGLTLAEVEEKLHEEHIPFAKVRTLADLPDDPQVQANEVFYEREHPVAGRMRETRPAPLFSETPTKGAGFAPTVGQHTKEILTEIGLGDEIKELVSNGGVAE